jgi:uncharacterized membrane protein
MNVEVNFIAVLLATVSTMVVGSVWYSLKTFGKSWEAMTYGVSKRKRADPKTAILITLVVSLLSAYVLAHFIFLAHTFFQNSWLQDSVTTAFWAWLGFTAARLITHDAFENRPAKLTLMNCAHELVTFLVMGVVIGVLHP